MPQPGMLDSYQNLLLSEFDARKSRRKSYSIRAFARDLEISPSYLSLLIKGKRVLDLSRAFYICERLVWPRERAKLFTLLVHYANAQSDYERNTILAEIEEQKRCTHRFELSLDEVLDQVKGFREFKAKIMPALSEDAQLNPFRKDIVITVLTRPPLANPDKNERSPSLPSKANAVRFRRPEY